MTSSLDLEDILSTSIQDIGPRYPLGSCKDTLSRSHSCYNGTGSGKNDSADADWDFHAAGRAWGRPESVWAEYLFTWNPLLAEIEAMDACQWLKDAGFPQYSQIYREGRFPIDLEMARRDHRFLDEDALEAVFRRLKLLNKCAENKHVAGDQQQKQEQQLEQLALSKQIDESEEDDDDLCCAALTDTWTYQRNSRQWCRRESPDWEIQLNHPINQSAGQNSSFRESSLRNFLQRDSQSGDFQLGKGSNNTAKYDLSVNGCRSTPTRSSNSAKKPSFLFEGDLLAVSSSSKDSVIVDESSGSSPSSFRSDDRERVFEPTTVVPDYNSTSGSINNFPHNILNTNDILISTPFQRAKVLSSVKQRGQVSKASPTSNFISSSPAEPALNSNRNSGRHNGEELQNNSLDQFILSEIRSASVSENDLEISSEFSSVTKSGEGNGISENRSINHARSKSATVASATKKNLPDTLIPVSASKTSPCDSEISVAADKILDKSLPSPIDQPFQRNTPITGSGRIRLALMKKMESLSGKKKKAIKAKDIGEPTVVESEKLREKLESLGCVNISPSVSTNGDKDKLEKIFQFDFEPRAQLSSKPSPVTPSVNPSGSKSLPSTPSLDQLDEVLERLRICEESIGKSSISSCSSKPTNELGGSSGNSKPTTEGDRNSSTNKSRAEYNENQSVTGQSDGNTSFCRAFNNIYRSSKKYTESERSRTLNLNGGSSDVGLPKGNANNVESDLSKDCGENFDPCDPNISAKKFNGGRQTQFAQNSSYSGSRASEVKLPIEQGSLKTSSAVAETASDEKINNGLLNVKSPTACSAGQTVITHSASFPNGAGQNITWKERLQMSYTPATHANSPCVNPQTELDDILDELYRNIDSLAAVRSKSLEPEGSKNLGWNSGTIPMECSNKARVTVTKSTDSALSSDVSNSRGSTLERKVYQGGSLRKPNLHTSLPWQQQVGAGISTSKSDFSVSINAKNLSGNAKNPDISYNPKDHILDSSFKSAVSSKEEKTTNCCVTKPETLEKPGVRILTRNTKSSDSSPTSDTNFKLGMTSNASFGVEDIDSMTEKSGGNTSHDEGSQKGLDVSVWDYPQRGSTPNKKDLKNDDDWTYAEDHRLTERRDSGIGSPLTKGRRQQKRARIRWHSFARSHRVSMSSQSRQISSLSAGQLVVLRKLSLLKLTATLEKYSNAQLSSKSWLLPLQIKKSKSTEMAALSRRVFGLPLTTVQQRHGQPLPECILRAMRHLRRTAHSAEGIFRKSGVKSRVMALRDSVESNPDGVDFSEHSAYDVADLLKLYLRELPDCLLTNKLSHVFIAIMQSNIPEEVSLDLLTAAVLLLPDEHRETLACLLLFLNDMSTYSHQNQMNASNLAICFAPAIFNLYALKGGSTSLHSRKDRNRSMSPGSGRGRRGEGLPGEKDLVEQKAAQLCLTRLISNAKSIFMVSEELIGGCRLTYIEQGDPVSLAELSSRHDGNISAYIDSCIQGLLKESRDKFKGWVAAPQNPSSVESESDVELKFKKVGDGHPLRLWKWQIEVGASPPDVLQRVLRERHIWDPDLIRWRVVATLDPHTEIFQYAVATMAPHPARDFCELRSWRSDLPRGACVLVSTSVEHPEAPLSEGAVRGVVLASRYLIEPCPGATGRSRLTHISRIDIRGHSLEWYNSILSHLCANQALAIRDSFLINHKQASAGGPETVV